MYRYQPSWCEENAALLCRDLVGRRRHVVFISNPGRTCALFAQRAGRPGDGLVIWDYHVVVLVEADGPQIFDLDCLAGAPLPLEAWIAVTFPCPDRLPVELAPRFRVVEGERFLATFTTDRSHMRTPDGGWLAPPPPWPPPVAPGRGMNLMSFVDMVAPFEGEVLDLAGLRSRDRSRA